MKNSIFKKAPKSPSDENEKSGVKSSGTSSNIKTGNVSEEQKHKRTDASWKK